MVAIKAIAKKNLAKSQNLLGKEIKILKVRYFSVRFLKGKLCCLVQSQWPTLYHELGHLTLLNIAYFIKQYCVVLRQEEGRRRGRRVRCCFYSYIHTLGYP